MTKRAAEPYILGSGELYLAQVTNVLDPLLTTNELIETAANHVGAVKGASVSYVPTTYEIEADNYGLIDEIIIKEVVLFKIGLMTITPELLNRLAASTLTDGASDTKLVIGGKKRLPKFYLRFVQAQPDGGVLRVTMPIAANTKGFDLAFERSKETVTDAEFKGFPFNSSGEILEIIKPD